MSGSLLDERTPGGRERDGARPISARISRDGPLRHRPPIPCHGHALVVRAGVRREPPHPVPVTCCAGHRSRAAAVLAGAAPVRAAPRGDRGLLPCQPFGHAVPGLGADMAVLSVTPLTNPAAFAARDGATALTDRAGVVPNCSLSHGSSLFLAARHAACDGPHDIGRAPSVRRADTRAGGRMSPIGRDACPAGRRVAWRTPRQGAGAAATRASGRQTWSGGKRLTGIDPLSGQMPSQCEP